MASGSILTQYIKNGDTLKSSLDTFNKLSSQKDKANWLTNKINSAQSIVSKVTSSVESVVGMAANSKGALTKLQNKLADLQKGINFDSLLKKIGLGDNALVNVLSSKFGLKSGLFDSWASDIINAGMSYANSMVGDIGNGLLQQLYSKLIGGAVDKLSSNVDTVILNTIVKPLRYTGSNPNYKNTLLRACLESDLPKCLDYLDGYNNTYYLHNNNMWKRGTYAAQHGCWKVCRYILENLNDQLIFYDSGTSTGNEDIAFWYKEHMVLILKTCIVYGYSNLDTAGFNALTGVNPLLLRDFSYYGENDTTFNKKYRFTSTDINIMAKIVKINKFGADNRTSFRGWRDPGAGTNIDVTNYSHVENYIDARNGCIKQIYVLMANGPDLNDSTRLINKELHLRLKYPMLDILSKANSQLISTALNSKAYNDLRYLVDTNGDKNGEGFIAGLISNSIVELQKFQALRTLDDIYAKHTTINNKEKDIGDFRPYEAPIEEEETASLDTSNTQYDDEDEINNLINQYIIDDAAFDAIGMSSKDFRCINITGLSDTAKSSEITAVIGKGSYEFAEQRELNVWNNTETAYSTPNIYLLYSTNPSIYNSALEANKERIFKQMVAIDLLKRYAKEYEISVLQSWHGDTSDAPIYEQDAQGNTVYDENNEPVIATYYKNHVPDAIILEILEKNKKVVDKIRVWYQERAAGNYFTITFDAQGIGGKVDPIRNISPYTILEGHTPPVLTDTNRRYIFLGWAKNFDDEVLFDFSKNYISKDMVLYAVWEEAHSYMLSAKLLKSNNSTLTEDIYATINQDTKQIYFPIKESEATRGSYIINFEISKGATCSLQNNGLAYITTEGFNASVTDFYGNRDVYSLKAVIVPEDAKRIAYMIGDTNISGFSTTDLYVSLDDPVKSLENITVSKTGYTFNNWLVSTKDGKITEIDPATTADFTLIYPKLTELSYGIDYNDETGLVFSGNHQSNYPIKFTFSKGAKLDTPEKEGYTFLGYYSEPGCSDEFLLRNIPKFYTRDDITLYAKWIDTALYNSQRNGVTINGYTIDFSKIVFYTRYVVQGGEQWVVTNTGLARYTAVGDIISRSSFGVSNTPLGITYVSNANVFLCLTKSSGGRWILYKSEDRGINWDQLTDITGFDIRFFTGTGFETLEYLTFFTRVLYKSILFEIKDNKIYVENEIVIDESNVPAFADVPIAGISVTVDGAFYILVVGVGIIRLTFIDFEFERVQDENDDTVYTVEAPREENIIAELIKPWSDDDNYNVDSTSIGSAYNNINLEESDLNDDFDIDNPEVISNILRNASDTEIYIRTYRNASRLTFTTSSDGKVVPVYGPSDDNPWVWVENPDAVEEDGLPPVLWLSGYGNQGLYRPNISNPKELIKLTKRNNSYIKESTIKTGDLFEYHDEVITSKNWRDYIGWTRRVDGNDVLLTESNMNEYWNVPNKVKETWSVKIDKYEMKTQDLNGVENSYHRRLDDPAVTPSDDFTEYKRDNYCDESDPIKLEEYNTSIRNEQASAANAYKDAYTVTRNANGTKRYDGITEDFYNYITRDYTEDAVIQQAIYAEKHPS